MSGQKRAVPPMWWSPSAGEWFTEDPDDGICSFGPFRSLADSLPSDAERLVPAGPLLELVEELDQAAQRAYEQAEGVKASGLEGWAGLANGREDCAHVLAGRIRVLLGGFPEPTAQEGSHD